MLEICPAKTELKSKGIFKVLCFFLILPWWDNKGLRRTLPLFPKTHYLYFILSQIAEQTGVNFCKENNRAPIWGKAEKYSECPPSGTKINPKTLQCALEIVTQQISYEVFLDVRSIPNPPKGREII